MFTARPLDTPSIRARQPVPMLSIAAENPCIPLKENWAERWCTLPINFKNIMEGVLSLEVRPDDVFVVTFMKCGTTWMQETVWLLMNNLDFETAKKADVMQRSITLDFSGLHHVPGYDSVEQCRLAPSPRIIKSHLPANLLPHQLWEKKQKIVYVARNLKDVVVSSFHFINGVKHWQGNIDEYVEDFMKNELLYTPFWAHIVDFWKMRNEPFIFFVTYEEMKRDLAGVLQRLCTFLERPQLSAEELAATLNHLSFENMKANRSSNPTSRLKETLPDKIGKDFQFMRRGVVGSYKDELTAEHQRKLDAWSCEFLAKHGIKEADIFGEL